MTPGVYYYPDNSGLVCSPSPGAEIPKSVENVQISHVMIRGRHISTADWWMALAGDPHPVSTCSGYQTLSRMATDPVLLRRRLATYAIYNGCRSEQGTCTSKLPRCTSRCLGVPQLAYALLELSMITP